MVQGIMELLFDVAYLATGLTIGIILVSKGKEKFFKLFGWMAIILAAGDAFHLIPRFIALLTTGLEANAWSLGLGKLITSITMTFFYVILYYILEMVYQPSKTEKIWHRAALFSMALLRIVLCALPQNEWFVYGGSFLFGILRNIPFMIMGIQIIALCFMIYKKQGDVSYMWMGIMVIVSFGFYIPVVLWADTIPLIGMLMIPKTLAYVGVVVIGLIKFLKQNKIAKQKAQAALATPNLM